MEVSQHRQREETWPVMRSRAGVTCWVGFFLWERHYLKYTLARETAKCAWRCIRNVLLICWDHLEWFSVVRWRINKGRLDWRLPLISKNAIAQCIILELMLLSSRVGTSLKPPRELSCSSVNYSDTLPFNSGEWLLLSLRFQYLQSQPCPCFP